MRRTCEENVENGQWYVFSLRNEIWFKYVTIQVI